MTRQSLPITGWERIDRGWYWRDGVGDVLLEEGGWFAYPANRDPALGPYLSLVEGIAALETVAPETDA